MNNKISCIDVILGQLLIYLLVPFHGLANMTKRGLNSLYKEWELLGKDLIDISREEWLIRVINKYV